MANWAKRPIEYLTGTARAEAVQHLKEYRAFPGYYFDRLARKSEPFQITAQDIVAVRMLSIDVPSEAAIRILEKDAVTIESLLRKINPPDLTIWDPAADLSEDSPAWQLWELIDENIGVGPTTTSKLLAAKRPHLLPIYDSVVGRALFTGRQVVHNYWRLWTAEMLGPDGPDLQAAARSVQAEAGYDADTSVLRVIDIVVWMKEHRIWRLSLRG